MALLIGEHSVVSMHYKLTDDEGAVIDSSEGGEPMEYLHGANNIIPGLENALVGKKEGDFLHVKVAPAQGYGEADPEGTKVIERAAFEGVDEIEVGMSFEAQAPDGTSQRIFIKKIDGDQVTIDINHPLAGINLNFDVQIVSVRESTEEERSHGHAHTPGHEHH